MNRPETLNAGLSDWFQIVGVAAAVQMAAKSKQR
jgi:hypothetical protein